MAIYVDKNRKIKNIFVNVNGEKKSISSAWVNSGSVPTKVFQSNNKSNSSESDSYEIAPENECNNWNYNLDDNNNTIILCSYKGSETDVIVYANYKVNGKMYKTELWSNPSDIGHLYSFMFNSTISSLGIQNDRNKKIETITFSDGLDTRSCTSMQYMFAGCTGLKSINFGANFDTSNVTNILYMFSKCSSLTEIKGLENFDTSNANAISSLFRDCSSLTSLDLCSFDTRKMKYMNSVFRDCSNLKTIYVTKGKWVTSQAEAQGEARYMFTGCGTSSVTYK